MDPIYFASLVGITAFSIASILRILNTVNVSELSVADVYQLKFPTVRHRPPADQRGFDSRTEAELLGRSPRWQQERDVRGVSPSIMGGSATVNSF